MGHSVIWAVQHLAVQKLCVGSLGVVSLGVQICETQANNLEIFFAYMYKKPGQVPSTLYNTDLQPLLNDVERGSRVCQGNLRREEAV